MTTAASITLLKDAPALAAVTAGEDCDERHDLLRLDRLHHLVLEARARTAFIRSSARAYVTPRVAD